MSRSYKKNPWWKDTERGVKKAFNRRLRRSNKQKYIDIPNGNAYRKCNEQWELCDVKFHCSWENFRDRNLENFDNEEKAYAHWKRYFGSK